MIVVTGANGQLGRAIVESLLTRLPAEQLGVSVREPEQAAALSSRGVRVRQGSFTDATSLRHAFEGASQLLLVSSGTTRGDTLSQHRTAIEAARSAGVQRIVYTSHMGASDRSLFPPMRNHAATEVMLRESGLAFVALRNGFYASSASQILSHALESGELVVPEDGPVSWTAHADLADAAMLALTDEARFDGPTPPLTGVAALDLSQAVALLSELTGRPIRRVVASDESYRASMVAQGLPEAVVAIRVGLFLASRASEFAAVDPTLARQLARPPQTLREVLAAHLALRGG